VTTKRFRKEGGEDSNRQSKTRRPNPQEQGGKKTHRKKDKGCYRPGKKGLKRKETVRRRKWGVN